MEKNHTFVKKNAIFGGLLGVSLILVSVLFHISGKNLVFNPQLNNVIMLLSITCAFIGIRKYREEELQGFISYALTLGGFLYIISIGTFIYGIYIYFLFRFTPELQQNYLAILDTMLDEMYKGTPILNSAKDMMEHLVTPFFISAMETFNKILTGLIFSLLPALILRRRASRNE